MTGLSSKASFRYASDFLTDIVLVLFIEHRSKKENSIDWVKPLTKGRKKIFSNGSSAAALISSPLMYTFLIVPINYYLNTVQGRIASHETSGNGRLVHARSSVARYFGAKVEIEMNRSDGRADMSKSQWPGYPACEGKPLNFILD